MFYLQRNLPLWERALRSALGLLIVLAAVGLGATGAVAWAAGLAVATLVLTGFVGYCPACAMAGRRPMKRGR